MTGFEYAAILGASAWLYPLCVFIHRVLARPKLNIITAETLAISYTHFGPIINFHCSISSKRKDAIIEKLTAEITHAQGERHNLIWTFCNEPQFDIRPYSGEGGGTIGKSEVAIALKINTKSLVQKTIVFQDNKFRNNFDEHLQKLISQRRHLEITDPQNLSKKLVLSREFTDFRDFFKNGMYWRSGKYTLRIKANVVSLRNPYVEEFNITINDNDIEKIRKNSFFIEEYVKATMSEDGDQENKGLDWFWAYPIITKLK